MPFPMMSPRNLRLRFPQQELSEFRPTVRSILTFDEKIVAVDGAKGMLDGKTITPTVTGKSLIYPYTRLAYETEYTFSLPAGAVTDRSGNA